MGTDWSDFSSQVWEPQTVKRQETERELRGHEKINAHQRTENFCSVQFAETPGHVLQLAISEFSSDKHFGPFNWLSYFSQDRLQSNVVCIHCYTKCGDVASVSRDVTIKSTALPRQTGWLKALLLHRASVTEITLSAAFPHILSTSNDQRTEIIVRDLSHVD